MNVNTYKKNQIYKIMVTKRYVKPLVKVVKVEVEEGFATSLQSATTTYYGGVGIESFSDEDENDGWAF